MRNHLHFEFNFGITYLKFIETRWRMPNERMMRKRAIEKKKTNKRQMNKKQLQINNIDMSKSPFVSHYR